MKLTKKFIRGSLQEYGQRVEVPDDGFTKVDAFIESDVRPEPSLMPSYYRTTYGLTFHQAATHRAQEANAVKDNVASAIHDALYGGIIAKLHRLEYDLEFSSKDEIRDRLKKIVDYIES